MNEILAIKRSMTKNIEQNSTKSNDSDAHPNVRVYESLKNGFDRNLPRMKTKKYTLIDDVVKHCAISVYKNHKKVFDCEVYAKPSQAKSNDTFKGPFEIIGVQGKGTQF